MKLLLTSNGITNKTIADKLSEIAGKDFSELKAVFIPTAMNTEPGDKTWFVENLNNVYKLGFKEFDIADISALPKDKWLPKLEAADVIFCNGGSNFHLIKSVRQSGLFGEISRLLQNKIWVGASSGGMIMSPYQSIKISQEIYKEDLWATQDEMSLGLVDFHIVPHLNGAGFPKLTEENLRNILKDFNKKVYVIDDNMAIAVEDGKVEMIGEGKYFVLN